MGVDVESMNIGVIAMKCEFTGCKHEAKWQAVKLFGDRKTLHVCDQHKPDASKRPASLKNVPMYYEVRSIANALDAVPDLVAAIKGFLHADRDVFESELSAAQSAISKANR